ncbi:redoxin domain-containing protein [Tropicimonas sediminicola]|uniref:Peroxiredoxin n=1 Tax=Tropicimonas sediminicola TaxID=1031541 RepID=A0A239FGM7_9RHOB|nr:redoxin domain-containing protein [Tropicimonas sediminicola]SNS55957.1 Peroxiredoxin [Tropicimonas sediminicola]
MTDSKPAAGGPLPHMAFPKLGGGQIEIGGPRERHTLLVVYRGKHCGRCKKYLAGLEALKGDWEDAGFDVIAVSADPEPKAQSDVAEFGWSFDVGYDLGEAQMRTLGLYVSEPLSPQETDRRFAEPAVFCVRPDGIIQVVCLSNGPAARPDLAELLDGMKFNIAHNRPARGTA